MTLLKNKQWPAYVIGCFIGLLQIPLFLLLNKTINGSGGFLVLADWICAAIGFNYMDNSNLAITWWGVAFLGGIGAGAFISAWYGKRNFTLMPDFWRKNSFSQTTRIFLGLLGGFCMGLGVKFAGDSASFEEITSIALLEYHGIIVLSLILVVGFFVTRLLHLK